MTLLALILFFQVLNPKFLSYDNVTTIFRSMPYTGILAVGLTFCLVGGMLDISMGAIAGFASVMVAYLSVRWGWNGYIAIGTVLLLAAAIGFINGKVTTKFKVSSIIVTIGSMYVVRGIANWISDGYIIYPLGGWMKSLGEAQPLNLSWAFFFMLVALIVGEITLRNTIWGLCVKATGSDRESAWCNNVEVDKVTIQTFMILGIMAAISGVFLSFRINSGLASVGAGWELNAIAACAIGGVSLFGYEGSMVNTLLGLLIVQVLSNGLVVIGIPAHLQPVAVGIVMVISVVLDMHRRLVLERSE